MRGLALERTAYHEAGHAVAAFLQRIAFHRVSILREGRTLGVVKTGTWRTMQPDIETSPRVRDRMERETIVTIAGPVAEQKHAGVKSSKFWGSDRDQIVDYISCLCGSEEEVGAYIDWLWIRTKLLIHHDLNWPAVRKLAEALLKEKTISGPAARRIIHAARMEA